MQKLSTLIYTVNIVGEKEEIDFYNLDSIIDEQFSEFKDVFEQLDNVVSEPREEVIEALIDLSRETS